MKSVLVWILLVVGLCNAVAMIVLMVALFRSFHFVARQIKEDSRLRGQNDLVLSPKQLLNAWPALKEYVKAHHRFYWCACVAAVVVVLAPIVLVTSIVLFR